MFVRTDCRTGKSVQIIDPGKDKDVKDSFSYVSCMSLDESESWLVRISAIWFHFLGFKTLFLS